MISAINATALIGRADCPAAGFVLWHSLTCPPKTVAQELKVIAIKTTAVILLIVFFILNIILSPNN